MDEPIIKLPETSDMAVTDSTALMSTHLPRQPSEAQSVPEGPGVSAAL